jgi:HEAT repeat protein
MEALFGLVFIGLSCGLIWALSRHAKAVQRAWGQAAETMGLDFYKGSRFARGMMIVGRLSGFDVTVDLFTKGSGRNKKTFTRIIVDTNGAVPSGITLKSEGFISGVKRAFGKDDILTGDRTFDDEIEVQGDEAAVVAALDERSRMTVRSLVNVLGAQVVNGDIYREFSGQIRDTHALVSALRAMVEIAGSLSAGQKPIETRLLHNASADSIGEVRKRNLEILLRSYAGTEQARAAADFAIRDADPIVRLLAAEQLGAAGLDPMCEIAKDFGTPVDVRIDAIRSLARIHNSRAVHELKVLVDDGQPDIALAAVDVLVGMKVTDDRFEPLLLANLDDDTGDLDDRIQLLGVIGTLAAVEPLLKFTKGLFTNSFVKSSAREAVNDIQSRAGGAEAGGLSIAQQAADGGGELSVAQDEGDGSLAIVAEDAEVERGK